MNEAAPDEFDVWMTELIEILETTAIKSLNSGKLQLASEFIPPWVFRFLKKKQKSFLRDISQDLKEAAITEADFEAKFQLKLQ